MKICDACITWSYPLVAKVAVTTVFSPQRGTDAKRVSLCQHHLDDWHRWRDLIYGEGVKPRLQGT